MRGVSYGISVPVISAKCQPSLGHETRSTHVYSSRSMDSAALNPFQPPDPDFLIPVSFPPTSAPRTPNPTRSTCCFPSSYIAKHIIPLLGKHSPSGSTSRGEGTREAELGADPLDTVGGVEVLDHDHLEAGGAALAGGDGGPGQEELPDAVPALAVLGVDDLAVAQPVAVPPPEGARVVDADGVDAAGCVLATLVLE